MELHGAGVEHIGALLLRRAAGGLSGNGGLGHLLTAGGAGSGGVVDGNAGLHVVGVHAEGDPFPAVLHAVGLHQYAGGHQVVPLKDGGHPVEHMVVGLLHIVGHQVLKGQHPVHVHVPGAGDEVLLVGVLAGELEADQVAAVVQILPVILHIDPAAGLHRTDALPVLGGHEIGPHAGVGHPAPAQRVQVAVGLKGVGGVVVLCKVRNIVIDRHIGIAAVIGQAGQVAGPGGGGALDRFICFTSTERQGTQQSQRQQSGGNSFHLV